MLIDINAARLARAAKREGGGGPIEVPVGDERLELPAELPATVIDRLLDPEVEIAQLVIYTLKNIRAGTAAEDALAVVANILTERPDLPLGFVRAVKEAVADLFGEDQWARWKAQEPTVQDEVELIKGLIQAYGAGLGDFFSSFAPATPDGLTSSATSSGGTDSTPGASGNNPEIPASLASAV